MRIARPRLPRIRRHASLGRQSRAEPTRTGRIGTAGPRVYRRLRADGDRQPEHPEGARLRMRDPRPPTRRGARGREPGSRAPRRAGSGQDGALGLRDRRGSRPSRPAGGRRRVGDGARVRLPSAPVRADARSARAPARSTARCAARGVRAEWRAGSGSLPGRACGAQPAVGRGRGAPIALCARRRPVVGRGVSPGTRVRRPPVAGGATGDRVRDARAHRRAQRAAGAGPRRGRGRRCRRVAGLCDPGTPGRAGPRDDHRRDTREPPRASGTSPRLDAGGACGRVRAPRRTAGGPHRAELPPAGSVAPASFATAAAHGGGGAARRRHPALARCRATRGRTRRDLASRGCRADRGRRPRAVPASAGALGDLSGGGAAGPVGGTSRAGRGDGSGGGSRSPSMASRPRGVRPGRSGRRRVGALGRPGAAVAAASRPWPRSWSERPS